LRGRGAENQEDVGDDVKDGRSYIVFSWVGSDGPSSAQFALSDFGSAADMVPAMLLERQNLKDYVLSEAPPGKETILDVQERVIPIKKRILLRVRAHRAQPEDVNAGPADYDVWFNVWDSPEVDTKVIFSTATLTRLGFYIAHYNEHAPRPGPMEGDPAELLRTCTSVERLHEHIVRTHLDSERKMKDTLLPQLKAYMPKGHYERLAKEIRMHQPQTMRTELLPGDGFRGIARYKSEPSERLERPRPQHAYPPHSWKNVLMLQQLAVLVLLGVLFVPTTVSPYAIYMFLANANTAPRAVANTGAAAGNIVKVQPRVTRTLGTEINKQKGKKYRVKFDIKGAFHLNCLAEGASPDITQVRYGDLRFQYTRTIMGEKNSAEFLNLALDEIFGDLPWLSRWMDDLLLGADTWDEFVDNFIEVLRRCALHGVVLNIGKIAAGHEIYWCGSWFTMRTIRSDSHTKEILNSLEGPDNGAQLAEVIGLAEWFSKFVPQMNDILHPLRVVLERIYQANGTRESRPAARQNVRAFGWTDATAEAFQRLKVALRDHQELYIRDPNKVMVLYTDASTTGWSGILLQCSLEDLQLAPALRAQQLVECCGGSFTASQRNWPTVEQEAYAVVRSIYRFWHHLVDGSTVYIFTDNQALSHIFDPGSEYVLKRDKPGQGRLLRWIAKLMEIPYSIQHVPGVTNSFADVVSRLRHYPTDRVPVPDEELSDLENMPSENILRRVAAVRIKHNLWTLHDKDWVQPSIAQIREYAGDDGRLDSAFAAYAEKVGAKFDNVDRVWKKGHLVVIPPIGDLRAALIVSAHSGLGGHRGVETTLKALGAVVFWTNMEKDVNSFVKECIHCLEKVSHLQDRPWGLPPMPQERNDIVSFDYLFLGPGRDGFQRVLVVTDKLTSYTHLYPAVVEDSASAVNGLIQFMSKCGRVKQFMSDQGTAFNNQVMGALSEKLGIKHLFTTAHSSWSNGKQERLNLTIANLFRTLMSENQMLEEDWPLLVGFVELVLNSTPTASLGWKTPIECFLAMQPVRPLDFFVDVTGKGDMKRLKAKPKKLEEYVEAFRKDLKVDEARLVELQAKQHEELVQRQARQRGVESLKVERGDFVMILDEKEHKRKLGKRWRGPAQVQNVISEHVVEVQYLSRDRAKKAPFSVHSRFLKVLDAESLAKTPELLQHAELSTARKWVISSLVDLRKGSQGFEVLVKWDAEGYDPSWEPIATLVQDVPELVRAFLDNGVPATARALLPALRRLRFIARLLQKGGSVPSSTE
jgi:hypothetical protein